MGKRARTVAGSVRLDLDTLQQRGEPRVGSPPVPPFPLVLGLSELVHILRTSQISVTSRSLLSHRSGDALTPLVTLAQQAERGEKASKGISQTRNLLQVPLLQQERERAAQVGQFAPHQRSHRLWMLVVLIVERVG